MINDSSPYSHLLTEYLTTRAFLRGQTRQIFYHQELRKLTNRDFEKPMIERYRKNNQRPPGVLSYFCKAKR